MGRKFIITNKKMQFRACFSGFGRDEEGQQQLYPEIKQGNRFFSPLQTLYIIQMISVRKSYF